MFLFRSIFWLTALILVLPPSPDGGPPPRVTLLESALAFQVLAKDVSGLCDRHPEACATSRETFTLLGRKIATGRDMASAALSAGTGGSDDDSDINHGSLSASDLSVPWSGRGASPIEPIPASASLPISQPEADSSEIGPGVTPPQSTADGSASDGLGPDPAKRVEISLPQPRPRLL
ncbi:hypothetical protein CKO32_16675 [Afifella marina DSM 2698]|nr:hypothetical protein [Afifella marina DSM 2698]MBK1628912.1 hypothetical protein [Afifella marina]MBK5918291.1 hypothetical protein [Afifella marina]RAI22810.1 hypothetical protein CH311_03935 [Afifella marina DSM 2698]